MADQGVEQTIEFTDEARKALEERTKVFAEDLRLAAIEEAIRRRGSASEVNASDVLRAAASALEQESLKAYEKKIDAIAKMVEEQSRRNQANSTELSHFLTRRLESLTGAVGVNKEREQELQALYQQLQEQSFASTAELRNMLAHELRSLRSVLSEEDDSKPRFYEPSERLARFYLLSGLLAGLIGLCGGLGPLILRASDPATRIFALVGLSGLAMASLAGILFTARRLRILKSPRRPRP